jgi:enoyl-CoA hydratase/carnithine racemase
MADAPLPPPARGHQELLVNEYRTIRYELDGGVGTMTLARPEKRNAQNPLMWDEIADLGAALRDDAALRCLVVAGDGPGFSAGIDLVEGMAGLLTRWSEQPLDDEAIAAGYRAAGTFNWIPALGCPSVAAVQGHALGAGLQLALACDFRVFAESAKVGLTETRYGILPDMGATVRLPRIVGEARARELILLGDVIDAEEALRIGLANRVVPDAELATATAELAARLAAQAPLAMRGARRAIDAAWSEDADDAFRVAVEAQAKCLASDEFRAARDAISPSRVD